MFVYVGKIRRRSFYSMRHVLREDGNSFLLKTSDHKEYGLDQRAVEKLGGTSDLSKKFQFPILPTGKGKVSSCLWIKNVTQASENTKDSTEDEEQGKSSKNTLSKCKGDTEFNERKSAVKTEIDRAQHYDVSGKEQLQESKKSSKKREEKRKPKSVLKSE